MPLIAIMVMIGLTGCQGRPRLTLSEHTLFSSEGLCGFPREDFGSADSTAVEAWINAQHGGVAGIGHEEYGGHDITVYRWQNGTEAGSAWLRDSLLLRIVRLNVDIELEFGDVVNAFGQPTWVYRHYEARERVLYAIDLEYPQLGFSVGTEASVPISSVEHGNGWAVQLRKDMKVMDVSCFVPVSSLAALVQDAFLTPPEGIETQLRRRTTWPGFDAWISLTHVP